VDSFSWSQWYRLSQAGPLPASWSEADYNWRVALPGEGHSSPVLWGEKIFLMSADPRMRHAYLLCYSASDGALLWRRDYPSTPHPLHLRNTFASGTAAVDSERVYWAWSTPDKVTFLALDHQGNDVGAWIWAPGPVNTVSDCRPCCSRIW
jgi:outer membrane protein assembly factor BamB